MVEIVLLLLASAGAGSEPLEPDLTVDAVVRRVIKRQTRLSRLYIDGYMTTTVQNTTQTDRFATALAPRRCFLDFMHWTGPDTPPWHDNARFQLWLEPDRAPLFMPFKRAFFPNEDIKRIESLQDYWTSPYAKAIGWHPDAEIFERAEGLPFYLDHMFASGPRDRLVIRQQTEQIGSLECVVLETTSGSDRLWLAPDLGFALVRRTLVRGEGRDLKKIIHCRRFREATEGLWLPWEIESKSVRIADGVEEPVRSFRIDVTTLAVNEAVPDAMFEFQPPPGTITYDGENEPMGFEPEGEELLDLWGALCADVFPPSPRSFLTWEAVVSAAICVVGSVAAMIIALLRRRRPGKPTDFQADGSSTQSSFRSLL